MSPLEVSRQRFEELVADALDTIPEELASHVENCAVFVEDSPTGEQLEAAGVPSGATLLGLYEGIDLTHRSPFDYAGVLPDRITIFMGPHLRACRSEAELASRIRRTVVHEVAHHFGISDERLHELGWA